MVFALRVGRAVAPPSDGFGYLGKTVVCSIAFVSISSSFNRSSSIIIEKIIDVFWRIRIGSHPRWGFNLGNSCSSMCCVEFEVRNEINPSVFRTGLKSYLFAANGDGEPSEMFVNDLTSLVFNLSSCPLDVLNSESFVKLDPMSRALHAELGRALGSGVEQNKSVLKHEDLE